MRFSFSRGNVASFNQVYALVLRTQAGLLPECDKKQDDCSSRAQRASASLSKGKHVAGRPRFRPAHCHCSMPLHVVYVDSMPHGTTARPPSTASRIKVRPTMTFHFPSRVPQQSLYPQPRRCHLWRTSRLQASIPRVLHQHGTEPCAPREDGARFRRLMGFATESRCGWHGDKGRSPAHGRKELWRDSSVHLGRQATRDHQWRRAWLRFVAFDSHTACIPRRERHGHGRRRRHHPVTHASDSCFVRGGLFASFVWSPLLAPHIIIFFFSHDQSGRFGQTRSWT
jgi:hypothetical protein